MIENIIKIPMKIEKMTNVCASEDSSVVSVDCVGTAVVTAGDGSGDGATVTL